MEEFKGAKIQLEKEIREAVVFLRTNNQTIPSETIEFMKVAALERLQGKNDWISVKDRLPEFGVNCIFAIHTDWGRPNNKRIVVDHIDKNSELEMIEYGISAHYLSNTGCALITKEQNEELSISFSDFWMPLPTAPN